MTLHADIEIPLARIEQQCQHLVAAVHSGEPAALEEASQALRLAAIEFSRLLAQLASGAGPTDGLRQRLQQVSATLAAQRTGLRRRSAAVEGALHAMVPATRNTTYAPAGPYAGAARSSGAFKVLAA